MNEKDWQEWQSQLQLSLNKIADSMDAQALIFAQWMHDYIHGDKIEVGSNMDCLVCKRHHDFCITCDDLSARFVLNTLENL